MGARIHSPKVSLCTCIAVAHDAYNTSGIATVELLDSSLGKHRPVRHWPQHFIVRRGGLDDVDLDNWTRVYRGTLYCTYNYNKEPPK